MHLDLFLRGKIEFVSVWESHVQVQYFRFRMTNIKTGNKSEKMVQMGLRRGIFGSYELIFPKEALPEVLAFLGIVTNDYGVYGGLKRRLKMKVVRKLFGDESIPENIFKQAKEIYQTRGSLSLKNSERCLTSALIPDVAPHIIGIKYDKYGTVDGVSNHELL